MTLESVSNASQLTEMVVDLAVGKELYRGRLIGTGTSEAIVEFPSPGGPVLPIAEKFQLTFQTAVGKPLGAVGRVIRRFESDTSERYHFHLAEACNAAVRTLFNRRGALRIWPDPKQPVSVQVKMPGAPKPVLGQLKDISMSGMAFCVPEDVEAGMFTKSTCQIAFKLPDSPVLAFEGHIRHRALSSAGIIYGVEFEPSTRGFEDASDAIGAWVRKREIEIIRLAREEAEE